MGQYHLVCNITKRQFIHPHKLGDGLKLMELAYGSGGVLTGLALLLAVSNGRGGGDYRPEDNELVGSWGGDRIAIVGDYGEPGDLPEGDHAESIYGWARDEEEGWRDISLDVAKAIEADGLVRFSGSGWRERTWVREDGTPMADSDVPPNILRPDMVIGG